MSNAGYYIDIGRDECLQKRGFSRKMPHKTFAAIYMDAIEELMDMDSRVNKIFFNEFIRERELETNTVVISTGEYSRYEKDNFYRAIKILSNADFIKRIKNRFYIINPYKVAPPMQFFDGVAEYWEKL